MVIYFDWFLPWCNNFTYACITEGIRSYIKKRLGQLDMLKVPAFSKCAVADVFHSIGKDNGFNVTDFGECPFSDNRCAFPDFQP